MCAYCGSRQDVDLQGWAQAEMSGRWPERSCPDCRIPLEEVRLEEDGNAPVSLGRCPDCMGMFLGPGSIETLLSRGVGSVWDVNRPLLEALGEAPRTTPAPIRSRPCPCCGDLMNRFLYGTRSGVIVDRCREHGLWLDAGELRQLFEWARAGGALLHEERRAEEQRLQDRQEASLRGEGHLGLLAQGLRRLLG